MGEISKTIRVPMVVDLDIGIGDNFSSNNVQEFMSYMKNMVAEVLPNGRKIARVRPTLIHGINNLTADTKGRGIHYWLTTDDYYFINNNTIYRNAYANVVGTITAGHKRVSFTDFGTSLFLVDHQNNQAWTISSSNVLAQVTDVDFPATLAGGGPVLNGRAYVLAETGTIYNSALDDPTSWSSLEFTEAERSPDGGVYITTHHDHLVVFGKNTIEFFYDNANPTGSPLTRRNDVFYNVGLWNADSIWTFGDVTYFLARDSGGVLAVYRLVEFQLQKVSHYGLESYLQFHVESGAVQNDIVISGYKAKGKELIILQLTNAINSYITSAYTFAFDQGTSMWHVFTFGESTPFYLVDWAPTNFGLAESTALGILANGDVVGSNFNGVEDFDSQDIYIRCRTGWEDGGTNKYKYCRTLELVANSADDETVTVSYSDTTNLDAAYTVSRAITSYASSQKTKLSRLGRFVRRNWQVSATVDDEVRLEALELEVALGDV